MLAAKVADAEVSVLVSSTTARCNSDWRRAFSAESSPSWPDTVSLRQYRGTSDRDAVRAWAIRGISSTLIIDMPC